ncbi:cation transporter [Vibrio sp. SCSIO 43136]|uniref:cation transporter n=1 Tax=Vibrio sp. SCSIO 43136 TaxID=2819101 RepID=UPI002075E899|nr:cation transporter [Vibrio sp. SCSIO 43136]USD65899.1 cation transporter [Vibrio sp. SCSIO 43136]
MMFSDRRIRTSATALVIDLILTGFRIFLAWLTASVALTADALHSFTDMLVSFALLLSMIYRFRQEKSGCERRIQRAIKLEAIAVILVSLLILAVPFEIYQQTQSMQFTNIQNVWWGVAGIGVVMLVLLFIAKLKMLVGIETDSEALKADSQHTKVDLMTSAAVMLSLVGSLVGINIDEYVALLIAVMIMAAGAELLISGIRSLTGHDSSEVSLWDWCYRRLIVALPRIPLKAIIDGMFGVIGKVWKPTITVLFLVYLSSGITTVPQGFVGVQSRFGKIIEQDIEPGLVLALPAPIEKVELVPSGRLYSLRIGGKNSFLRPAYGSKLWHSVKQSQLSREDADYLLTGDEKLMFLTADVQYRISEPSAELTRFSSIENLLSNLANAVLISSSTKQGFNQLQEYGFNRYAEALELSIAKEVQLFDLPVDIVSVNVQQIEPPAYLVAQYRDALDAFQESHTLVNQANAWSLTEIPKARAEHFQVKADAKAQASKRIYSVEGETGRFQQVGKIYKRSPEAYRFNQQVEIAENALSGKPFTVVDPAFSSLDFRIWGNNLAMPALTTVESGSSSTESEALLSGFEQSIPVTTSQNRTETTTASGYSPYEGLSEGERSLDAEQRDLLNKLRVFSSGR